MTVAGQAAVNYSYDNANRLTQITQGTVNVVFSYDSGGRVSAVTHSNGIAIEYTYDASANLTGITYKKNAAVIGNVTYEYDALGKRVKVSGSFARTGLPQAFTAAVYGLGNRLTQRSGANFTYDANGNLTNDGTFTYNWNARNELTSMNGPGIAASFEYDASGARIGKTVNGQTTNYLHDGEEVVQEQFGASAFANILSGGLDKPLLRSDGSVTRTPLTDALGSTLALSDDDGVAQTEYSYDPFGNTSTSGAANTNASKYTGREDDGTGLYYYRARYYSPALQRFISEDPSGFAGDDVNLYTYAKNDPVNLIDPLGLCSVPTPPDELKFNFGNFGIGFTEGQMSMLDEALRKISRKSCQDWLVKTLEPIVTYFDESGQKGVPPPGNCCNERRSIDIVRR